MSEVKSDSVATADFTTVTELAGDAVSPQQVASAEHRYRWATRLGAGKDILEVACGSGVGLGMLEKSARSIRAGDITPSLVAKVKETYGDRIDVSHIDAHSLPLHDESLDVVIMFEALYYLPNPEDFVAECRRVLRSNGLVLLTTANKDAPDFNESPFSEKNWGIGALAELFSQHGFEAEFFGYWPYSKDTPWIRVLKPVKRALVASGFMPRTMNGKKLLKRLAFGKLVKMPAELTDDVTTFQPPTPLANDAADRHHRVIYVKATLL